MSDNIEVLVMQTNDAGTACIRFEFVALSDAMEFVSTCVECGDDGTVVKIKRMTEVE